MGKIYHVVVNGKTFESSNLKLLISRAVAEKRNLGRAQTVSPFIPATDGISKTEIYTNNYQSVAV